MKDTLLPEMFVEITYTVTEPGVQKEAVASGSSPEVFSDVTQITDLSEKHKKPYATLDYGCWGLDGSFGCVTADRVDPGYVDSKYSGNDGNTTATITIDLENRHTVMIPGLVITWDDMFGGWATDFRITASNQNGIVAQKTVRGNTDIVSYVYMDIVDYSTITIDVLKWSHPYQRMRCFLVHLGMKSIYTKNDLLGYEHSQSVDLLSAALPKNSITFKLRNDDDRWNPANPTGLEKYLTEQQKMEVRYGMDINGETEWIEGGTFWLSEWDTPSNGMEAVFTARDAIEFMNHTYTGPRSGTLFDIAVAAFTEANLPTTDEDMDRWFVDDILQNYTTDFTTEDSDYTIADVLQMVAHAAGCVFYQDRFGMMSIAPWIETYSDYIIDPQISYNHPEHKLSKPLKAISVGYGEDLRVEIPVGSRGETQTVDNEFIVTEEDALRVGDATKRILENRGVIEGEFRADLRVDALDCVIVTSKYSSNVISITDITYSTTGGAFRGKYTGRVVSIELKPEDIRSNELYTGEVW